MKKYLEDVVKAASRQQSYIKALESEISAMRQTVTKATERAARRPRTPNLAVFVSDVPRAREAKLAYGLSQAGWKVVLLHREPPTFDAGNYCAETIPYRNPWEALILATGFNPVVYHVFSNWNFSVAALFVRHKPGKVIFDDYDVMAGMVKDEVARKNYPGQLEQERFCLENADGLCCRSLETQYARRHLGYRYRGVRVLFPDFCWQASPLDRASNSPAQEHPSVAYCGNISTADPKNDSENCHYEVADLLSRHKIHYHIYPSASGVSDVISRKINEYLGNSEQSSFIHVHATQKPRPLIEELAKHDYGLHIYRGGFDENHPVYTGQKLRYSSANKIFDYVDAGLPVLIHPGAFQRFLLTRYKVGATVAAVPDLLNAIRSRPARIRMVPKNLRLETNIHRLVAFYQTVGQRALFSEQASPVL